MIGSLFADTRGVSPAVTQALTIGISTLLVTGLLIAGGSLIEGQTENVAREGLIDIGSGVATDLVRLDQFNTSTLNSDIEFRSRYPERVAGEQYRISLVPTSSQTRIYVNSTVEDYSTVVRFENQSRICSGTADGGAVTVRFNTSSSAQCMEIRD
ncbi:DUF7266 family protein [Haloarcula halophila]|jgi:hypothetical protein|uniref:DUF7266 family protein n=1 Tax=Haloarcula TaxID=2237 RepID=UPI0023E36B0C|nr:hypothetical protein [Halomicroarcula sp. DFY41]